MSTIRLSDGNLQALANQMVANGGKIGEAEINQLIDAAYGDDGRLSGAEKRSLRALVSEYQDAFESGDAKSKLATYNRMANATLRDAAHNFAKDGGLSADEARQMETLAMKDGRISKREKVTLKALMGFYSPHMEPGAKELVAEMAGVEVLTDPSGPTGPIGPIEPTDPTLPLGPMQDRFNTMLDALKQQGNGTIDVDAMAQSVATLGDGAMSVEDASKLFENFSGSFETPVAKGMFLDALQGKVALQADDLAGADKLIELRLGVMGEDGVLSVGDLKQAETSLTKAGLSESQAESVLRQNLGEHQLQSMDATALGYVQREWGAMEGHRQRLENILGERVGKHMLIDANFDGKLDKSDMMAFTTEAGTIELRPIGDRLSKQALISEAMVSASMEMDRAGHDFALIKDHRANEDFFELVPHGRRGWSRDTKCSFKLKEGVKASDAMDDIFNNPDKYGFECATAMVIVYYRAMQDLLGDEDFDRIMGDLQIGPWDYENDLASIKDFMSGPQTKDLVSGDYTYIKNWDVSDEGKKAGWQGENVIYLGDGKYYGHPFGVETADHIINYLNGHRNDNSDRSASRMDDLRMALSPSLFRHDRTEND